MTPSIADIDPNFRPLALDGVSLVFRSAVAPPFQLSGLPWFAREGAFCRLPQSLLPNCSEGVRWLAWNTAGGMIRFRTDSPAIGLDAELLGGGDMPHMPRSGSGGFDLYVGAGRATSFRANLRHQAGSPEVRGLFLHDLPPAMRDVTIYLPLYNGISRLAIGLAPDASVEAPTPFRIPKPILFYGSSITQGGCASRPGNSYAAILTRRLDAPQINWGFSGNGCGEPIMAETIASLDLAAFVLDYDHNAPTPEHLEATHEPFFRTVRDAHPDLPIVCVSMPDFRDSPGCLRRREIIRSTVQHARNAGDTHAHFVDGETLFGVTERDLCTVDGCHPNDVGFLRMADGILPALRDALAS